MGKVSAYSCFFFALFHQGCAREREREGGNTCGTLKGGGVGNGLWSHDLCSTIHYLLQYNSRHGGVAFPNES